MNARVASQLTETWSLMERWESLVASPSVPGYARARSAAAERGIRRNQGEGWAARLSACPTEPDLSGANVRAGKHVAFCRGTPDQSRSATGSPNLSPDGFACKQNAPGAPVGRRDHNKSAGTVNKNAILSSSEW